MCGIFGYFHLDTTPLDANSISKVQQSLRRRGPDQQGVYQTQDITFIHQRLAIIDPDSRSAQPMSITINGHKITIIYNGECYNYIDLKEQLIQLGHHFKTQSDTEVLLVGYLEWGSNFIKKINGMFALAIFDERSKSLFISRDRLGIKPLFYTIIGRKIIFSSDIKSILIAGAKQELDKATMKLVLKFRYNPLNNTIYKNITKLDPGSFIVFDGNLKITQYWSCNQISSLSPKRSYKNICDEFYSILSDSVKVRLQCDVNLGTFLSGGIDSSVLTAMAAQNNKSLKTFSFDVGGGISESTHASQVANYLNVDNTSIPLQTTDYKLYEQVTSYFDEPILDSIITPTYLLAKNASQHVKVVLSGEGADEILGGYVHHHTMVYANLLYKLFPFISSRKVIKLISLIPQSFWEAFFNYPSSLGKSGVRKLLLFLGYLDNPITAYLKLVELFGDQELLHLDNSDTQKTKNLISNWNSLQKGDLLQQLLKFDLKHWGSNYTLSRLDTLTMANSLEARVPFFDHKLVEFALSIPSKYQMGILRQKTVLRDSIKSNNKTLIPLSTINRKKQAFFIDPKKSFEPNYISSFINNHREKIFLEDFLCENIDVNKDHGIVSSKKTEALIILSLWLKNYKK